MTDPDPNFYFESERLRYSHWLPDNDEHAAFLLKLWTEPLFIAGEGNTGIDTLEKAHNKIKNSFVEDMKRNGYGNFMLTLKDGGKKIGMVSLMRGKDSQITLPDVGFAILTEENGKGYGPEAGRAAIEWLRKEKGIDGAFGFCNPKNARSRRAMEKSGLVFKGLKTLYQFGGITGCCYALPDMKEPEEYGVGIPPPEKEKAPESEVQTVQNTD